jgi:hypothetical protein
MRTDSFACQVLAVFSRRAPAFLPSQGEPSTFPGAILYHRLNRPHEQMDAATSARGRLLGSWVAVAFWSGLTVIVVGIGFLTNSWRPEWVSLIAGLAGIGGPLLVRVVGWEREEAESHDSRRGQDDAGQEDRHDAT